jgi:ElaB/YqjD/DUF883 family membrane-anchored ribosome-binding protein
MFNDHPTNSFAAGGKNAGDAAVAVFHDTAVTAKKTAHGLNEFVGDFAHDAKDTVRHLTQAADKEASRAFNAVRDFVEDRPKASMGVVAAMAIAVGFILWRRR